MGHHYLMTTVSQFQTRNCAHFGVRHRIQKPQYIPLQAKQVLTCRNIIPCMDPICYIFIFQILKHGCLPLEVFFPTQETQTTSNFKELLSVSAPVQPFFNFCFQKVVLMHRILSLVWKLVNFSAEKSQKYLCASSLVVCSSVVPACQEER